MKIYRNATILYHDELARLDLATDGGKIVGIAPTIVNSTAKVIDCSGKAILPALIDIHTHGAAGFDFNRATLEQMHTILTFYLRQGVGSVYPTLVADDERRLLRQLATIAHLSRAFKEVKGINLEGPFLSPSYAGAIDKRYLQQPSVDKFCHYQDAAEGLIKLTTIAPELPGAVDFIKTVSRQGVVVSLGHSAADFITSSRALAAGATCFTHTFNAMPPFNKREPNITTAALLSDAYTEVIADGVHVSPETVSLLAKSKGADRVVAVTDSIMAAGKPDGVYSLGDVPVEVVRGEAFIQGTTTRAGSTLTASAALANFMLYTGLPLPIAIKAMTETPAGLLGVFDKVGSIEVGKAADLLIVGE
jgi:N-acetylglucosamine-6-phosphate deacetylase